MVEPHPENDDDNDDGTESEIETQTESDEEAGVETHRYLPRPLTLDELFTSWEYQVYHWKIQQDTKDMNSDRRIVPFDAHNEEPLPLYGYPHLYPLIRIDYYTQSTYQLNHSYVSRATKILLIRDLLDIPLDKSMGLSAAGGEQSLSELWGIAQQKKNLYKTVEERWYLAREMKDRANIEVALYSNLLACILRIVQEDRGRSSLHTLITVYHLGIGCWTCAQTVFFSTTVRAVRLFVKRLIRLHNQLVELQRQHPNFDCDWNTWLPTEEAMRLPFYREFLEGDISDNGLCRDLDSKKVNIFDERFQP
ncbi:hypothetical protein I302_107259 [Kwoniella bestiolae CBS 10118]|uniref:Uncharacterized protein n=1 Tax=Kwoniella bestiolae CBS 10118 TaxID=1296100 RepID=A0A1B9FZ22_9TREE|nr:hypothetical protein I302_07005 [Kwoniella bestiolae CBS 10118]OCF24019.1 hypothetical protein I302_07005 [Kwoniella bestiolae CBS 10118]